MTTNNKESSMTADLVKRAKQHIQSGHTEMGARFYRLAGEKASKTYDFSEALIYFDQALTWMKGEQQSEEYAVLMAREAIYQLQGSNEPRLQDLTRLETIARRLKDDIKQTAVSIRQAQYNLDTSNYRNAITIVQLAIRLAQLIRKESEEAKGHLVLGQALSQQGNFDSAWIELNQALELAEAHHLKETQANSLNALGLLFADLGEFVRATDYYDQALAIFQQLQHRPGLSNVLNNLGIISHAHGRYMKAKDYWDRAHHAFDQMGNRMGQARTLTNLGTMLMDLGDYSQSQRYHEDTLKLCQDIELVFGQCLALINLSLVYHYQNDHALARSHSLQALELAKSMDNKRLEGYALTTLGHAQLGLTKLEEAEDAYWQSVALWQALNVTADMIEAQAGLAAVALQQKQVEQAHEHVIQILEYLNDGTTLDGVESPFRVYLICYQVLQASNNMDQAKQLLQRAKTELLERMAEIVDDSLQQSFVSNVPVHRALMAEAQPQTFTQNGATVTPTVSPVSVS